jgi:nucleoside-diphosphate-sugar epimerase
MTALGREVPVTHAPMRAGELQRSCLDVSKAAADLGWRPEVAFDEGLTALAGWFEGTMT